MHLRVYEFTEDDREWLMPATLVMMSPNGHREYIHGCKGNLEQFIEDGYVTDKYGFKWKAWIE